MGEKIHIDIQGGEGITQAIQRMLVAKGAANKDGVVKTSIWTEVQKYFVEETESDSDNEISILHHKDAEDGDNDNIGDLWHTFSKWKIPTEVDDYIEIAEATWNKILKLVGLKSDDEAASSVTVRATETIPTDNTGTVTVTASETIPVAGTGTIPVDATKVVQETVDPNPPAEDSAPPADVKPFKASQIKQDKKPPKAIPAPVKEVPSEMSAEEIAKYNAADASKAEQTVDIGEGKSIQYDAQGHIIEEITNGNATRHITRKDNGEIEYIQDYVYNDKGEVVSVITRNANGAVTLERYLEHDKKGNETLSLMLYRHEVRDYTECEYDSKGRVTKEIERDKDGNVVKYTKFKYDSQGNVTKKTEYDAAGRVTYIEETKYKKGNKVSAKTLYADENGISGGSEWIYPKKGELVNKPQRMVSRSPEGKVNYYVDYEYDGSGKKSKEIYREPDGKVQFYYEYTTDAEGKRISIKRDPSGKELERTNVQDE